MLFRNSYKRSTTVMLNARRRNQRPTSQREPAIAIDKTRLARAFYCDVLH